MGYGSIYYHYDKTGSILEHITNSQSGDRYIITGNRSLNAFPMAFINTPLSEKEITTRLMPYALYKKICDFIQNRDLSEIDSIIVECKKYAHDWYKERLFRELIFEKVRLHEFHKRPSRLSCMFLALTEESLQCWINKIPKENDSFSVYEFETQDPLKFKPFSPPVEEVIHIADAKWLENKTSDINEIFSNSYQYWSGTLTKEPIMEILYFGILKLVKQTDNSYGGMEMKG